MNTVIPQPALLPWKSRADIRDMKLPYFWSEMDRQVVQEFTEPSILYLSAISILEKIKRHVSPVYFVIGPMTTGGLGSVEENFKVFEAAIELVRHKTGGAVFNQVYFEDSFQRYTADFQSRHGVDKYPIAIMEDFYGPLLRDTHFHRVFRIEGWETSKGASWENKVCEEVFMPTTDIAMSLIRQRMD